MESSKNVTEELLARLLMRSEDFEDALSNCFPDQAPVLAISIAKCELSLSTCLISTEHAFVLRSAFASMAPNSAAALLRLQFEALLRSAWLLYSASPEQIAKLDRNLDEESERIAKNLPGLMDMLAAVEKLAPHGLSAPLTEFNHYHRHALNSFVHGGIHPIRRSMDGFPLALVHKLIVMSNGLLHLAYRIMADLSSSQARMNNVTRLYIEFADCLPVIDENGRRTENGVQQ